MSKKKINEFLWCWWPRSEVIAKCIDEDTEVGVVNDVIQREVEDAYSNIQKYLATLNPLRDFW